MVVTPLVQLVHKHLRTKCSLSLSPSPLLFLPIFGKSGASLARKWETGCRRKNWEQMNDASVRSMRVSKKVRM